MQFRQILTIGFAGIIISATYSHAQGTKTVGCLTDEMTLELEKQFPNQRADRQAIENQIQQYISWNSGNLKQTGIVLKIPVVVHIVTDKGLAGISKAQVLNGLD